MMEKPEKQVVLEKEDFKEMLWEKDQVIMLLKKAIKQLQENQCNCNKEGP